MGSWLLQMKIVVKAALMIPTSAVSSSRMSTIALMRLK